MKIMVKGKGCENCPFFYYDESFFECVLRYQEVSVEIKNPDKKPEGCPFKRVGKSTEQENVVEVAAEESE